MGLNSAKALKGYQILENYTGKNPYIIELREKIKNNKSYTLTTTQINYIIDNQNYNIRQIGLLVRITDYFGEKLATTERLGFIPTKIMVDWLIGETDRAYHIIGRLTTKQKPTMYFVSKSGVIDDFSWEPLKYEIDWDKFSKRLIEVRGYDYLPHQKEGVEFLLQRDGCILADGMGVGKTIQAVTASLATKLKRVLIVCPSSLKINWYRELSTFTDNISIVNGQIYKQARFTIINYDILKNFHTRASDVKTNEEEMFISRELVNSKFDLVIIDEAHNVRNKDSIRGDIISDICVKFNHPRVWLLTGTPVANRPKDFYNLLKIIRSPISVNYDHYMRRYCKGRKVRRTIKGKVRDTWVTEGEENLDELADRVRHLILRRTKEDVLDMPPKVITNVLLELNKKQKERYDLVWSDYLEKRLLENKRGNPRKELVELGLLKKFVAMEAIPYTEELAKDAIDNGEKVVIFTTLNEEQDQICKLFDNNIVVRHNGSMSEDEKQQSVDRFQNDPEVKVFVGNIISAGTGITLTAGTVTIFNSYSWVPGDNDQAEDRTHRLGQQYSCSVYYMCFVNTISEIVLNTLKKKRSVINKILEIEDVRVVSEMIINELINSGEING